MKETESREPAFKANLASRKRQGRGWKLVFVASTVFTVFFLVFLVGTIVDQCFGYVIVTETVDSASLAREGVALDKLDHAGLGSVLAENLSGRRMRALEAEKPLADRSRADLLGLARSEVVQPEVDASYNLSASIFGKARILADLKDNFPGGKLVFRSWVDMKFLSAAQSSDPLAAGIRGALIGSVMTILITLATAFPLGIGAAIWLEEYARDNALNRFIRVNIYNLAGVPSIIYGMLGLALFVRMAEPLTSGAVFRLASESAGANGRTILSAGLTLALLVLPVIIINAQEAIKAVPNSLRYSSLAVGATKWQTVLHHVLPASMDRILTGTVLAVSRAIGETAPLVVVGASTFLSRDPTSIFSKFTTLPIQIYQWTARPQSEFRNIAAAAILVLLVLMMSLNAFAIVMRNKYRKQKRFG